MKKRRRRHLQDEVLSACEEDYETLYNNTKLGDAAESYYDGYFAALELLDIDTLCTISDDELDTVCDFRGENGVIIAGQPEFESACTGLGARVVEFNFDIDCDMVFLGMNASLGMYFTDPVDCVPANCEDEAQSVIGD
jgi:hypothetical protein